MSCRHDYEVKKEKLDNIDKDVGEMISLVDPVIGNLTNGLKFGDITYKENELNARKYTLTSEKDDDLKHLIKFTEETMNNVLMFN